MPIDILVLSLLEAVERRNDSRSALEEYGLKFSFFDAVDAQTVSPDYLQATHDAGRNARTFKRPLSRGEIACALSHRLMWRAASVSNFPATLICEDDIRFLMPPQAFFEAVGDGGAFEDVIVKLDGQAPRGELIGNRAGVEFVLTSKVPARTTCYLIGRRAAAKLFAAVGPVVRPVDLDLKHYWEHGVPILVCRPQIVTEREESISYLKINREMTKPKSYLLRLLRNIRYQSNILIGRHMTSRHATHDNIISSLRIFLRKCK